jgi:hypothetical protein
MRKAEVKMHFCILHSAFCILVFLIRTRGLARVLLGDKSALRVGRRTPRNDKTMNDKR